MNFWAIIDICRSIIHSIRVLIILLTIAFSDSVFIGSERVAERLVSGIQEMGMVCN